MRRLMLSRHHGNNVLLTMLTAGGLWPTYVVKRVVDKMSWIGCQVPAKGCVLYDPNVSVRALIHSLSFAR